MGPHHQHISANVPEHRLQDDCAQWVSYWDIGAQVPSVAMGGYDTILIRIYQPLVELKQLIVEYAQ